VGARVVAPISQRGYKNISRDAHGGPVPYSIAGETSVETLTPAPAPGLTTPPVARGPQLPVRCPLRQDHISLTWAGIGSAKRAPLAFGVANYFMAFLLQVRPGPASTSWRTRALN